MVFPEKILLLYGHHRGTTGSSVEKALRQRVELFSVGPGHVETETSFSCSNTEPVGRILKKLSGCFEPDVVFVLESGVKFFPAGLAECPLPCWYYAIDPHMNLHWQREYAKLFDLLLVSFKQFIPSFQALGHPAVHWLPHGFDNQYYRDWGLSRDIDIAFVGDMDPEKRHQRALLLKALGESGLKTLFTTGIWNEEVARIYSRSRLVFNDNDTQVFNPRNFEGSACGSVVLTNPAISLEEFFTPDEDIVVYHNAGELVARAKELIANPAHWQRMAQRAQLTAANNSWDARINVLAQEVAAEGMSKRHAFSYPDRIKAHAFVYFHQGLPGQTIALLDQLEQEQTQDVEVFLIKALAYSANEFYDAAAKELNALLHLDPLPDPVFLQQISNILIANFEKAGHAQGALRLLQLVDGLNFDQKQRLLRISHAVTAADRL